MPKLITVRFVGSDGLAQDCIFETGQSLMRAATEVGVVDIVAMCGGCLSCATCHVVVEPAWVARLPPPSEDEEAMLDMTAAPREAGSRLSCQILLNAKLDGLIVHVPAEQ